MYVDVWEKISEPESNVISRLLKIISLDLRVYGAEVIKSIDPRISHVVFDPAAIPNRVPNWKFLNQQLNFKLVRPEWVLYFTY